MRRRLADARHDGPVPPDVAARLDEVLAGLRADSPGSRAEAAPAEPTTPDGDEQPTTVVPLRRRPARLPRYLLAAAAVVALGYGTTQVIGSTTGSSSQSDSAGSGADTGSDAQAEKGVGSGSGGAPSAAQDAPPSAFAPLEDLGITGLEPLEPGTLDEDLAALDSGAEPGPAARRSARRLADVCGPATPVPGARTLAAAYDGRPTLVVYLPPESGAQRVDLYLCDAREPRTAFRSVTLPAGE